MNIAHSYANPFMDYTLVIQPGAGGLAMGEPSQPCSGGGGSRHPGTEQHPDSTPWELCELSLSFDTREVRWRRGRKSIFLSSTL